MLNRCPNYQLRRAQLATPVGRGSPTYMWRVKTIMKDSIESEAMTEEKRGEINVRPQPPLREQGPQPRRLATNNEHHEPRVLKHMADGTLAKGQDVFLQERFTTDDWQLRLQASSMRREEEGGIEVGSRRRSGNKLRSSTRHCGSYKVSAMYAALILCFPTNTELRGPTSPSLFPRPFAAPLPRPMDRCCSVRKASSAFSEPEPDLRSHVILANPAETWEEPRATAGAQGLANPAMPPMTVWMPSEGVLAQKG